MLFGLLCKSLTYSITELEVTAVGSYELEPSDPVIIPVKFLFSSFAIGGAKSGRCAVAPCSETEPKI